ncbi:hypothetical protein ON010_g4179 [Phytophthora cinnamomi]|nr:hypothetical protein ON010_g4179 [Phytophthora cinnamomi]
MKLYTAFAVLATAATLVAAKTSENVAQHGSGSADSFNSTVGSNYEETPNPTVLPTATPTKVTTAPSTAAPATTIPSTKQKSSSSSGKEDTQQHSSVASGSGESQTSHQGSSSGNGDDKTPLPTVPPTGAPVTATPPIEQQSRSSSGSDTAHQESSSAENGDKGSHKASGDNSNVGGVDDKKTESPSMTPPVTTDSPSTTAPPSTPLPDSSSGHGEGQTIHHGVDLC